MRLLILLGFAFWMVACTPSGKQTSSKEALSSDSIQYAQGFTVQRFDTYTMVEVRDPWDSTRLLQRYLLVDRTKSVPGGLPKGTIVKVPVKDIVVYTSVHAAIIDQLHEINKVIGVCEPRYMDTPAIQEGIQAGRIADLGEATSPNIEKMIEIGAELVIASPFQNSSYGPAFDNVRHTYGSSLISDNLFSLFFGSHKKNFLALFSQVLHNFSGFVYFSNCFIKVNDMNTIALHEDIRSHSGIPLSF